MASLSSSHCPFKPKFIQTILFLTIIISITTKHAMGSCFTSIFSFGDSLTDTGNSLNLSPPDKPLHFTYPPYGETYFHHPTGRCCDGRLIIDFIAEYFGLPLLPPYFGGKNVSSTSTYREGANFAVVGATVLGDAFFEERNISTPYKNISFGIQMGWFKELLQSLCNTSSNCNELLRNSLVVMGEIGGDDYNYPLLSGRSLEEVQSFVPLVINAMASAINELIKLGVVTLMVPGNLPIGCSAAHLTYYRTSDKEKYDPTSGCLIWLNKFSEYHNEMLQIELNRIQKLHPQVTIMYADYFNVAMRFYHSPHKFGFIRALRACCGDGGPYNYNSSDQCGYPPSSACADPFVYANWDGMHLTEAAYKLMAQGVLEGSYTTPRIDTLLCISKVAGVKVFQD